MKEMPLHLSTLQKHINTGLCHGSNMHVQSKTEVTSFLRMFSPKLSKTFISDSGSVMNQNYQCSL